MFCFCTAQPFYSSDLTQYYLSCFHSISFVPIAAVHDYNLTSMSSTPDNVHPSNPRFPSTLTLNGVAFTLVSRHEKCAWEEKTNQPDHLASLGSDVMRGTAFPEVSEILLPGCYKSWEHSFILINFDRIAQTTGIHSISVSTVIPQIAS